MKPKIIVTRDIPDEVESKLREYFQVSFNREDKVFSNDILRKAMENADGIVCTVTDSITDELLTLPNKKVKIIANIGVGVDHIDLQSAKENNVIITNTPDVLTEATVDVATLLLLSVTVQTIPSAICIAFLSISLLNTLSSRLNETRKYSFSFASTSSGISLVTIIFGFI